MSPNVSHIERYVTPSTAVAACQRLLPSAIRANPNTSGRADGSIIAAIITDQPAEKDPSEPRPIVIAPAARTCSSITAQATAATARKANAVRAGGASSTPCTSPDESGTRSRHAGQDP